MTDLLCDLSNDDRKIARMEAIRLLQLLPITEESREAMALLPIYLPAQGSMGSRKLLKPDYPLASILHWRPASRGLQNGSGCALGLCSAPYGFAKNMPRRIAFRG